jgi:hypothetical protein
MTVGVIISQLTEADTSSLQKKKISEMGSNGKVIG